MRSSIVPLLILVLTLGGCAAHEPRCTGALVPINTPAERQTVPDAHGQ